MSEREERGERREGERRGRGTDAEFGHLEGAAEAFAELVCAGEDADDEDGGVGEAACLLE